jgi:putative sterol carrier protein
MMPDPTADFFDELGLRGHELLLKKVSGTMRFDLSHDQQTDHWLLAIAQGDIRVSKEDRDADCVITGEKALFDRIAQGDATPLTAWLRNQIAVEGRLQLLILLERLLPGPPSACDPRTAAHRRRTS